MNRKLFRLSAAEQLKSHRDHVGFNFWLAVSAATCLHRLISPTCNNRQRRVSRLLFSIPPCRLPRKTWAVSWVAYNCSTMAQLNSFRDFRHFPSLFVQQRWFIRPLSPHSFWTTLFFATLSPFGATHVSKRGWPLHFADPHRKPQQFRRDGKGRARGLALRRGPCRAEIAQV